MKNILERKTKMSKQIKQNLTTAVKALEKIEYTWEMYDSGAQARKALQKIKNNSNNLAAEDPLSAAAPDLLVAAKHAFSLLNLAVDWKMFTAECKPEECEKKLRAAIAKAEGSLKG